MSTRTPFSPRSVGALKAELDQHMAWEAAQRARVPTTAAALDAVDEALRGPSGSPVRRQLEIALSGLIGAFDQGREISPQSVDNLFDMLCRELAWRERVA